MNKKVLFGLMIIFVLANVVYALEQRVYILSIKYDSGIITEESIKVISGEAPDRRNQPEEEYLFNLISFNNEILYSFKFNFPLQVVSFAPPEWFDDEGNQIYIPTEEESGFITLNQTTLNLVIPYFPDAEKIEIYSPENELLLEIGVGHFTDPESNKISDITSYFKEDKVGKVIKYIIYFIVGVMFLILLREGIIKIRDKYQLMKSENLTK